MSYRCVLRSREHERNAWWGWRGSARGTEGGVPKYSFCSAENGKSVFGENAKALVRLKLPRDSNMFTELSPGHLTGLDHSLSQHSALDSKCCTTSSIWGLFLLAFTRDQPYEASHLFQLEGSPSPTVDRHLDGKTTTGIQC